MPAAPIWCALVALALAAAGCAPTAPAPIARAPLPLLVDTDANNELDDQHALAYVLLSPEAFDVVGITVNRTRLGGGIDQHVAEARRVAQMVERDVPIVPGADLGYDEIVGQLGTPGYDGADAVQFILDQSRARRSESLVVLALGKLTNVALALEADPSLAERIRLVWLGSNYPAPREYNQANDEPALRAVLASDVPFEIALVRYGQPSGTAAVRVTREEAREQMRGQGPRPAVPVEGRDGVRYETFGDYGAALFEQMEPSGDPPSRALFDMAAAAILKTPAWATPRALPAPELLPDRTWADRPENPRRITLWEDFDRDAIVADFFGTLRAASPAAR